MKRKTKGWKICRLKGYKAQERSEKEVLKEILFPNRSYNSLALTLTGLLNLTLARKKKKAEESLRSCLLYLLCEKTY